MTSQLIIHIFNDDKFIDPTIKLFEEVVPGESVYFVIKRKEEQLFYVKSSEIRRVDLTDASEKEALVRFINSNLSHIVFLHALDSEKQKLVFTILPDIKKVWFIWGYDLYGNWPLLKRHIYKERTQSALKQKTGFKNKLLYNSFSFFLFRKKQYLKRISKKLYRILNNTFDTPFYRATQLIDYVVPVVPTEYAIVKRMKLKAQYAPFTYGCIEDLLGDKINKNVLNQPNILVGNSADPTNNHIEIFTELSRLDLGNRNVYVPLSYNGNPDYIKEVLKSGHELLGVNFHPLLDFMPLEQYNEILLSCGVLIFNHVRQQGVGNIIILGYLGATLFLNAKSPVYSYYKSLGMNVFTVKDISSKLSMKPEEKDVEKNQIILNDLYSRRAVHAKIKTLLQIVS